MSSPHEHLRDDDYLGALIDEYGILRLDPADDMFQRLVVSILRQQVSMAAAAATRRRLFEAIDVTPQGVLAADPKRLREAGLSQAKTEYVRNVAEAFDGEFSRSYFEKLDDDAVIEELTDIKGVGEWTARMQLLFSLGRPDVFPVGDLGVRKGIQTLFDREMSREEMVSEAERWAPYRSYATLYLWRIEEDIADSVTEVLAE